MSSRGRKSHLTKRDIKVLMFLWKFKVSTTAMLCKVFFYNIEYKTAYNVILRLRQNTFIRTNVDQDGENHVWVLTKKGFDVVKKYLPELRANCFNS